MQDSKLEKLKKILDILRDDTVSPEQLRQFLGVITDVVRQTRSSLIEENTQASKKLTNKIDSSFKELWDGQVSLKKAIKALEAIEVRDGKDADEDKIVEEVLSRIVIPEPLEVKLDDRKEIVEKINKGKKNEEKIKLEQIEGTDKLTTKDNLDRAISILDKRSQFLINKTVKVDGTTITGDGTSDNPLTAVAGSGTGDVSKVGTPVNNQVGVWTGDGTLEGDTNLTFDTTTDTLTSVNINATTFTGALTGHASSDALTNQTMYIGTTAHDINRASASEGLAGITSLTPGANFTLTQNSVAAITSEEASAVANTLYLKAGKIGIGAAASTLVRVQILSSANTEPMALGTASGTFAVLSANGLYGLYSGVRASGGNWMQAGRSDGDKSAYNISLQASGGNVGIGTASPTSNFQVSQCTSGNGGTVATNGTTTLTGSATQFTNIFKVGDTITVSGETVRTIATITSDTVLDVTVAFSTTASGLTYTLVGGDRFVVKGNGNVGIGILAPTNPLAVVGIIGARESTSVSSHVTQMSHNGTIGKIESTAFGAGSYTPLTFFTSGAEQMRIAITTGDVTMSGSLGITGTRVSKGWFTDLESTNAPTIGGVAATGTGGLVRATSPTIATSLGIGVAPSSGRLVALKYNGGDAGASSVRGLDFDVFAAATSAAATGDFSCIYANPYINSGNTQNWTNSLGFSGLVMDQRIIAGATGTVTTMQGLNTISRVGGMTVTSLYGINVQANTKSGAGAITGNSGIAIAEQTAGTNNTNLLIGTATIPTGTYSIYNSSTAVNYFASDFEFGHPTDTTLHRVSAGVISIEGSNILVSGGALGTPSSATLTNATGLPISGLTSSTSTALGVGSIELGHASDTTISRVSAGVIAVEGVTIPTISSTSTLTNKRTNPRLVTAASYTTDTGTSLDISTCDQFEVTAQAGALKFNNPGGTPVGGNKLMVRIKDDGTARALTYDTQFRAMGTALPSTTVLSKTLYMGFIYNATDTKWDLVGAAQEA